MKFNKLDVPHQWKEYFTKYPHGYTIFEALCNWTTQVDDMVDNQNNWIDYLDNFVEHFEFELQKEVKETIERWQSEGKLDDIINSALTTRLDILEDETHVKLGLFDSQLTETTKNLNDREINTMFPPPPLVATIGDGTDETLAVQNIINGVPLGSTVLIPKNVAFKLKDLTMPNEITIKYTDKFLNDTTYYNRINSDGTPINETVLKSSYHTGHVLDVEENLDTNVPTTNTTLARSTVYRKNGINQLIETVYGDGRFKVRHVRNPSENPYGDTVYDIEPTNGDMVFSKAIRMSTAEGAIPENNSALTRPLFGYSSYLTKTYYVDQLNGSDSSDGTVEKPFKSFEYLTQKILAHTVVQRITIIIVGHYTGNIGVIGLTNQANVHLEIKSNNTSTINGNCILRKVYGGVKYSGFNFKGTVEVSNSHGVIIDNCVFDNTNGIDVNYSDILIMNNIFNTVSGIKSVNSYVTSSKNTGTCTTALQATLGGIIYKSGVQPTGQELMPSGIIFPGASGSITGSDGKTATITNGIITDISS